MSSPVFATTTSSSPTTSARPRASLAPPVPPDSSATVTAPPPSGAPVPRGSSPALGGQTRDLDAGVTAVAHVDRDHQRGQRLGDARHLEAAAIHAAQAV